MLNKITWAVIYANIPLWIAIGCLAFLFQQWETVKLILYGNILVLVTLSILVLRHTGEGVQLSDYQIRDSGANR